MEQAAFKNACIKQAQNKKACRLRHNAMILVMRKWINQIHLITVDRALTGEEISWYKEYFGNPGPFPMLFEVWGQVQHYAGLELQLTKTEMKK